MELTSRKISAQVLDYFQDLCDNLNNETDGTIIVSHIGEFQRDFVSSLTDSIEELMVSRGDSMLVRKRMFTILIEGLENVRNHGDKDENGQRVGYLVIAANQNAYQIIIGNLVDNSNRELVEQYISKINAYPEEELFKKYASLLSNEFLISEGGTGLGLITTRIKTGNDLRYVCFPVNDTVDLFSFEVSLPRK
jgi:phosphotransferase system IIB component